MRRGRGSARQPRTTDWPAMSAFLGRGSRQARPARPGPGQGVKGDQAGAPLLPRVAPGAGDSGVCGRGVFCRRRHCTTEQGWPAAAAPRRAALPAHPTAPHPLPPPTQWPCPAGPGCRVRPRPSLCPSSGREPAAPHPSGPSSSCRASWSPPMAWVRAVTTRRVCWPCPRRHAGAGRWAGVCFVLFCFFFAQRGGGARAAAAGRSGGLGPWASQCRPAEGGGRGQRAGARANAGSDGPCAPPRAVRPPPTPRLFPVLQRPNGVELTVGIHLLEGTVTALKRPFAVLAPRDSDAGGGGGGGYEVGGWVEVG